MNTREKLSWTLLGVSVFFGIAAVSTDTSFFKNASLTGWLSLSGETNRLTVADGVLKLDGTVAQIGSELVRIESVDGAAAAIATMLATVDSPTTSPATITLESYSSDETSTGTATLTSQVGTMQLSLADENRTLTRLRPEEASSENAVVYMFDSGNSMAEGSLAVFKNNNTNKVAFKSNGAIQTGGDTNQWSFGQKVTGATVTLTTTNYLEITLNGVVHKVALVQ